MKKLFVAAALVAFVLPGMMPWTGNALAQETQAKPPAKKKVKRKPVNKKKPVTAAAAAASAAPVPVPAAAPAPVSAPAPQSTATPEPSPTPVTTEKTAPVSDVKPAPETKPATATGALYTVVDGYKVDAGTMAGFRTWRSAACDRCHGANQEGMVGPSLIERLKVLSQDEFKTVVLQGRLEKGMPSFNSSEQVVKSIDQLYAYLKGRSDGAITRAKVAPIE